MAEAPDDVVAEVAKAASPPSTVDVAGIVDAFTNFSEGVATSVSDLARITQQTQDSGKLAEDAIRAGSAAQQKLNTISEQSALKKKRDDAAAAASLGTNPDASSFVLSQMGIELLSAERDLNNRNNMIQKKMDQSFWDNPLEWLTNQVELPFDEEARDQRYTSIVQKNAVLGDLQNRTKEQFSINAAIDANVSTERLAAVNEVEAAKADSEVAKTRLEMAKFGIEGIKVRGALDAQQFNMAIQYNNVLLQQEQLALSKKADVRAEETLVLNKQLKDLQIEERNENLGARYELEKKLKKATDTFGMNPISYPEFKMMNSTFKSVLEQMMVDPDIQSGRMGKDILTALDNANTINAPLTPGMNLIRKRLLDIKAALVSSEGPVWQSYGKDVQQQKLNSAFMDAIKREAVNVPAEGGFFSPPPLISVLSMNAGIANTKIAAALSPLAVNNPMQKTDPDLFVKTALEFITTGQASPAEMANEISSIYRAINADNRDQRQYNRFSMPWLTDQTGFKTSVYTGFMWSSNKVLDMTSLPQLEATLTRMAIPLKQQRDMLKAVPNANDPSGAPR